MGLTPDRRPGVLREEGIVVEQEDEFGNPTVDPTEVGGMTYHDGSFAMRDSLGVFNPRDGGGGTIDDVKRLLITSWGHVIHDTIGELVLKVGP
jgi:hypothetical protein